MKKNLLTLILLTYALITTYYTFYPYMYNTTHPPEKTELESEAIDSQWKFLKDVATLITYADTMGHKLTGGELYRTMCQQRYYVRHGLSWTYKSNHLKRRAIDLNLFVNDKYQTSKQAYRELGEFWESLDPNNRWGGRFNDAPHFERRR